TTSMTGLKFKLAHKRADKGTWSASDRAQKRRLIKILEEVSHNLEEQGDTREKKMPARNLGYENDGKPPRGKTLEGAARRQKKPSPRTVPYDGDGKPLKAKRPK